MITVRKPHSQWEYMEACILIERIYREKGFCEYLMSKERPSTLLIAEQDGRVIGSVGIILASEPLPTEHYFGFKVEDELPGHISRHETFEICKLGCVGPMRFLVAQALIVALAGCAKAMGYQQAVACMKPKLLEVLQNRLHIPLHPIDKVVIPEMVEDIYQGYFLRNPKPKPVYLLRNDLAAYLPLLQANIRGQVRVELEEYDQSRPTVFERLPAFV
ncbi:MAG: hypothetical protein BWY68_00113 [bacterium ADurb.Bin400]|nr:MAG: hypothetical protein BWY68_00113 [bacterium ADurb.Bin400]